MSGTDPLALAVIDAARALADRWGNQHDSLWVEKLTLCLALHAYDAAAPTAEDSAT